MKRKMKKKVQTIIVMFDLGAALLLVLLILSGISLGGINLGLALCLAGLLLMILAFWALLRELKRYQEGWLRGAGRFDRFRFDEMMAEKHYGKRWCFMKWWPF